MGNMNDRGWNIMSLRGGYKILVCLLLLPFYILKAMVTYFFFETEEEMEGKIIMITGAGNGLGREMSLQLARLGAKIICVDIKAADLEETVEMLRKQQGSQDCVKSYICDISDIKSVEDLHDAVIRDFGRIDILYNNAGIIYFSMLCDSAPENIRRVVDVNVCGNIWMSKTFLKTMKEQKKGQIVFTSSMASLMYARYLPVYCATKAATTALALSIENELRSNSDWKDIKISIAEPITIASNELMDKNRSRTFEHLTVDYAASCIIQGARRHYVEYLVPGHQLLCTFVKLIRLFPQESIGMFVESAEMVQDEGVDEGLYKRLMSSTSNKACYNRIHEKEASAR